MWSSSQNAQLPTPPPPPFDSGGGMTQLDMQGNILNYSIGHSSAATFRWKGDIYMFGTGGVRKVDVNTLTSQVFDPLPFLGTLLAGAQTALFLRNESGSNTVKTRKRKGKR